MRTTRQPGDVGRRILLVRVGADLGSPGGGFNAPVDTATGEFLYVGIPETQPVVAGWEHPYARLADKLARMDTPLPASLRDRNMHIDPDFEHCTYGDHGRRAAQLSRLVQGDMVLSYAGLRAIRERTLVYALVGQLTVDRSVPATELADPSLNVHAQRQTVPADDVVVVGTRRGSGRYARCIPIGIFRDGAYRVRHELLDAWGGLSVKNGFLQRSAGFPRLLDPERFLGWLAAQHVRLVRRND
jgi:hypothetical protein